jgi:predicted nucleotidyltransferase component of viral defense system
VTPITDAQRRAVESSGVAVAGLADLTAMKLQAISTRGAARDFWDLHELLRQRSITLAQALEEFRRRYVADDVGHVVRSLAYFGDADAEPLPVGLDSETWRGVCADFERWVVDV